MLVFVVEFEELITFPEGVGESDFAKSHKLSQRSKFLQKLRQKSISVNYRHLPTVFKRADRQPLIQHINICQIQCYLRHEQISFMAGPVQPPLFIVGN